MKRPPPLPPQPLPSGAAPANTPSTVRRPFVRTLLPRLAMFLVFAASVAIVLWSIFERLLPVSQRVRAKTIEVSRLSIEVQQLDLKWSPTEAERVERLFEEKQSSLFSRDEDVAGWQQSLEQRTLALGLQPSVVLGTAQPVAESEPVLLRRSMDLHMQPIVIVGTPPSPYARLLGLMQTLERSVKRADFVALSVRGDSNTVQQAQAVFELWSQERGPP